MKRTDTGNTQKETLQAHRDRNDWRGKKNFSSTDSAVVEA